MVLLTISLLVTSTGTGLFDAYSGLTFRNPVDNNIVYPGDGVSHQEQCVLYSVSHNLFASYAAAPACHGNGSSVHRTQPSARLKIGIRSETMHSSLEEPTVILICDSFRWITFTATLFDTTTAPSHLETVLALCYLRQHMTHDSTMTHHYNTYVWSCETHGICSILTVF